MAIFQIDDIVFVKIKGSRHWPAKILEILADDIKQTRYSVLFFGDNKTAIVKKTNLAPYRENIHTYGNPLVDNFRNINFNKALKEAEIAFNSKTNGLDSTVAGTDKLSTPAQGAETLIDIQDKIKNLSSEEPDLETSLTLAAEVGNALLTDNNRLRIELQSQILENSKLAQKILETKNSNQVIYQDQIDKLENENQALLNKINDYVKALNEAEHQLEMERQLRTQLSITFEDQDREKEETIKKYEITIKEQHKKIENFKMHKCKPHSDTRELNKITKNIETQTNNTEPPTESSTHTLVEIEKMKIRLDFIENKISTMLNQTYQDTTITPGASHTRSNKLSKSVSTITDTTDNTTSGNSQSRQNKLNLQYPTNTELTRGNNPTPGTTQNRRKNRIYYPLTKSFSAIQLENKEAVEHKQPKQTLRESVLSISLQAAKYRAVCELSCPPKKITHTLKVQNGPPKTAKLLREYDSLEDFFTKNIEEAIRLQTLYSTNTSTRPLSILENEENCQTGKPFLAQLLRKQTKFKTGQTSNTTLKNV